MTDIRTRMADALREHRMIPSDLFDGCQGCSWEGVLRDAHDKHLADVLVALPGIAIVDLEHVDPIAEAIARNWPDTYRESWPWQDIPKADRDAYRGMARAALAAAQKETA